ncbi:MAG TPA: AgmX/PglI C-terminal domain-containing protein [Myxococcaceae bacterium]|nr:AgmX/PglI C-terminal domain-containing protein [Myxococcaceae bacterium]
MNHFHWTAVVLLVSVSALAEVGRGLRASSVLAQAGADGGVSGAAAKPPLNVELMPFNTASVKKVMAYNQDQIQACYEETLASKDKPVEGKVMTAFVVTAEGMVKSARVVKKGTTLNDPKLHQCLIEALSSFTFPKPSDHREHPIEYPFNLKAVR